MSASILRLSSIFAFLSADNQLAVCGSVQAGRGVDTGDPQLAKIALAHTAITGRVPEALEHGLICTLEQTVLGAALSLGDLQNSLVT